MLRTDHWQVFLYYCLHVPIVAPAFSGHLGRKSTTSTFNYYNVYDVNYGKLPASTLSAHNTMKLFASTHLAVVYLPNLAYLLCRYGYREARITFLLYTVMSCILSPILSVSGSCLGGLAVDWGSAQYFSCCVYTVFKCIEHQNLIVAYSHLTYLHL